MRQISSLAGQKKELFVEGVVKGSAELTTTDQLSY